MKEREGGDRIAYVDGLRGVAIGMVLLFHAWKHSQSLFGPVTGWGWWFARGAQGVSLFLVLSGFCLSYPLWRRREGSQERWFVPRQFFARRALRILPPYYAAFSIVLVMDALASRWHAVLNNASVPASWSSLVSQLLLVHNWVLDGTWVNGSFWSLGLEWQWYWVFPLVLLLCARTPLAALFICLCVNVAWTLTFTGTVLIGSSPVPMRLMEFCLGITVAWMLARDMRFPWWALTGTIVASLVLAETIHPVQALGLVQPLYGVAFGCLILLGASNTSVRRLLSIRPLVGLGVVSYSVYLIHEPVIEAVEGYLVPGLPTVPRMVIGIAFGLAAGLVLYGAVERPCLSRRTRAVLLPPLERLLGWTDWIYRQHERRVRTPLPEVQQAEA